MMGRAPVSCSPGGPALPESRRGGDGRKVPAGPHPPGRPTTGKDSATSGRPSHACNTRALPEGATMLARKRMNLTRMTSSALDPTLGYDSRLATSSSLSSSPRPARPAVIQLMGPAPLRCKAGCMTGRATLATRARGAQQRNQLQGGAPSKARSTRGRPQQAPEARSQGWAKRSGRPHQALWSAGATHRMKQHEPTADVCNGRPLVIVHAQHRGLPAQQGRAGVADEVDAGRPSSSGA